MNVSYYLSTLEDREQILKALSDLKERQPSPQGPDESPAVLIGSRAALHYDSHFRQWENPTTDADWDFIISPSRLLHFFSSVVGAKVSRLSAIAAVPFPDNVLATFSDASWRFLEVNLVVVLESGETLEFEVVDRSLSAIQNQSGAKLLDLLSNVKRVANMETPIGSAIVSPLEILVALKESHSILNTNWRKTIADLNRLKQISAPELIDEDSVSTFLELRKEECKLRRHSKLSSSQWKLLSILRRNLGFPLDVDGSVCLLTSESTFETLAEEDQIEYIKLECTAHLVMLQDVNSKLDLSDLAISRAQESFATSENYCESARYFAVSQNVDMANWMKSFLPSISSRCMTELKVALRDLEASETSQKSYLSNTRSSKNGEEAQTIETELTSIGEIPGDIMVEILSHVFSLNVIGRVSLCCHQLHRAAAQSVSGVFWRQLCRRSFGSFLAEAKQINPKVFPNELTFNWKRFYGACSRAKEFAVPNPPSTSLIHEYNITRNASHLLRTEATAIGSAIDKVAKQELQFLARWATITRYSKASEADHYDDPAWTHYQVDLRVQLPNLRVLTLSFIVSEDCRMYVKGDSKVWDDSRGRPVMNCKFEVWDEDGKYFDNKSPISFSENWTNLARLSDVDFAGGLRSSIFARPEVWCAIMLTVCPNNNQIVNYFKIGNFR
eukprot:TRINITY_DN11759_c0_g1_i1.p1 TRINITY_DN11759_c0_g1~~TRINITY_DN11759_c0_g1_i1.p1  ORF type:complete len:671 (+),score=106.91 TRINITY_DN11759_c0_g1_i1:113-2125(+)